MVDGTTLGMTRTTHGIAHGVLHSIHTITHGIIHGTDHIIQYITKYLIHVLLIMPTQKIHEEVEDIRLAHQPIEQLTEHARQL